MPSNHTLLVLAIGILVGMYGPRLVAWLMELTSPGGGMAVGLDELLRPVGEPPTTEGDLPQRVGRHSSGRP